MSPCRSALAALAVALAATPGRAACPAGATPHAVTARLDVAALEAVKAPLLTLLPRTAAIPEVAVPLSTCSAGGSSTITPRGAVVTLAVQRLDVSLAPGAVTLSATVDLEATGHADLALCSFPAATCDVSAAVRSLAVTARLAPKVVDCTTDVVVSSFVVTVDPADVELTARTCSYADAWNAAYPSLRDLVVGIAKDQAEKIVTLNLPTLLRGATDALLTRTFDVADLRARVAVESVVIDPTSVQVGLAAAVDPARGPAACLPAGAALPGEPVESFAPAMGRAMLSVAVARPLVERALRVAWWTGLLCYDSRERGPDLGSLVDGILPDTRLDFVITPGSAPSFDLPPDGGARVGVDALVADVILQIGAGRPSTARAHLGASIASRLEVDAGQRSLVLVPAAADLRSLAVEVSGAAMGFSDTNLRGLIANLLLPLAARKLGDVPLTTGVLVGAPLAMNLDAVATLPAHLRADFSLWPIDTTDAVAPVTTLASAPADPSGPSLALELASTDDTTATAFVRHEVAVDGVAESSPRPGRRIVVTGLLGGVHRVRLTAVDLAGNTDATPLELTVRVDDTEPEVAFTDAPVGITGADVATVRFTASDDLSREAELTYRYSLGAIARDNVPDVPLAAGAVGADRVVSLSGLPAGQLVRLIVYARDRAGNEGSAEAAFVVGPASSAGCRAATAPISFAWLWVLALVARCRRARGRP